LLNGFANFILKLIGIKPISEHEIHSEEELRLIIAESVEGGKFEAGERELIQNVFDFDDRFVKQIMVPRIKMSGIKLQVTIEEAVHIVLKEGYSRYPVYDKSLDDVIGVIHAKDLMKHFIDKTGKPLSEIVKKAYFISEHKRIDHLLREFQKMKIQIAIVVSEYGGTVGLVTLEDVIEELVGEIQDEHDQEVQIVTRTGSAYRVVATSSLHDINKMVDEPFPESDEYETLAGLILFHNPLNLKEGDEFVIDNYSIKILKMSRHLPELVELKFIQAPEEGQSGQKD
jgi:CBS domain containing-hemolysin-like protein